MRPAKDAPNPRTTKSAGKAQHRSVPTDVNRLKKEIRRFKAYFLSIFCTL